MVASEPNVGKSSRVLCAGLEMVDGIDGMFSTISSALWVQK